MKIKFKALLPILLGSALFISGCNESSTTNAASSQDVISEYVSYDSEDEYTSWEEEGVTFVNLNGTSADFSGDGGVILEENQILIRTTGTYVFEGTLDDGQIVVDAEDTGTVRLVLNGVTINSSTSAPIYIKQADKAVISLEEYTVNTLTDANEYRYDEQETEPDAAIFSNDDLTINGLGSLTVQGNYEDGIKSDDDLLFTGGQVHVVSADEGIVGKDLLAVKEANITVESVGDGLKASNTEDEQQGNIVLESGSVTIQSEGDGIQAEKTVVVADGNYDIVTGGGSPETIENTDEFGMGGGMERPGHMDELDLSTMIDSMLEGVDISDDIKEQLESTESMEELQAILEDYPELQQQLEIFSIDGRQNMGQGGPMAGSATGDSNDSTDGTETMPQMPNGEERPDGSESSSGQPPEEAPEMNNEQSTGEESSENQTVEDEEAITDDTTVSTKGVKAGTEIIVVGGTIQVDSFDDAVHSDGNVTISGGQLIANSGDDGIHANTEAVISGGDITIEKSLEGLEGRNITISDGTIHIIAADDGVNVNSEEVGFGMMHGNVNGDTATGEAPESIETTTEDEGNLLIEGGYLYVNADGDGLDSNNTMEMTGGTVIVYGPTNSGNGSLDYANSFNVEGGMLIAVGSSGMAQGISDSSSQNAIMMTFDEVQEAGTTIYVGDNDGQQIIALEPEKEYQTVIISSPELKTDESYTIRSGGAISGEKIDGLYEEATYKDGLISVDFTLSKVMTYLNESGVTEATSGMMGGFDGGNPFGNNTGVNN
ncbi:carbohydrate-binding domain-containing protein [Ureibacillus sp. 179-F W5.1 NHS]|uniref:carbohydrate-binding domain-containing protein n=1 Tax=Ureibacillus sp. 179-F W5.1 NHS TaxID=3374297 RepID=UPI0038797BB7